VVEEDMTEERAELLDADASIEPCLIGWSEKDEDGVEAGLARNLLG
jgi:hypothetical protein